MVAHVLRLRLDLLVGSLRGNGERAFRNIVGFLLLVAATGVVCWAILSLRADSVPAAYTVSVLAGSALLVGVSIAPAVGGVIDQLDPRRFAVFGTPSRQLAGALIAGAIVSIPSLAVLAVCIAMIAQWAEHGVSVVISTLSLLVAFITTVLVARVSMAVGALVFQDRRGREMTSLFALALIIVIVPVAVFLGSLDWAGVVPSQLEEAASVLGYTPFGAAWAIPGLVGLGKTSAAVISAVIAVVSLGMTVLVWFWVVDKLTTTTDHPSRSRDRSGLGWFGLLPANASGAIAARSLVYWIRDRRYLVNVAIVPIVSVVAALPLLIAGVPTHIVALVPVPIMALFLGWIPHNDVAYDSTAIWLHIVSGVRGLADRVGRLLPITLIALPLLAIAIPICVALYGRWALLPAMIGVALNLFLAGLGISSVSSVLSPYPATRPGDSPFQQPQRSGSGVGSQAIALVGAVVFSIPSLWYAWQAITDDMQMSIRALWIGIGCGFGVLVIGIAIGALLFDRRGSRIMEFAEAI